MPPKRKASLSLREGNPSKRRITAPEPKHYDCPEGDAYIYVKGRRIRIRVLLDSGSNVFLINETLVQELGIPYEEREKALPISGFDGKPSLSGGKLFTHPLLFEIGKDHHKTYVSCEVAKSGKYGLIVPYGWWGIEHEIQNPMD